MIAIVGFTVRRSGGVDGGDITVTLAICAGHAKRQCVFNDRSVDRTLHTHMVVITIGRVNKTAKIIEIRAPVGDVQGTRGRIPSK